MQSYREVSERQCQGCATSIGILPELNVGLPLAGPFEDIKR